jgi:uncharacterized membrane protein YczE
VPENSRTDFALRFARLQIGLFLFAFSISLMLESTIGLDPWSSFHDGLSARVGLSFGRISQLTGLMLIAISAALLRVRPGVGTVFNMAVIGPWLDLLRVQAWFPGWDGGVMGVTQFLGGMLLMGLATGLYIGANMGAGPRDGFVLGLAVRLKRSVRATRITVEVVVLVLAWFAGGALGLGTVLFALGMGPVMQASLRIMRVRAPVRATDSAPDPAPS